MQWREKGEIFCVCVGKKWIKNTSRHPSCKQLSSHVPFSHLKNLVSSSCHVEKKDNLSTFTFIYFFFIFILIFSSNLIPRDDSISSVLITGSLICLLFPFGFWYSGHISCLDEHLRVPLFWYTHSSPSATQVTTYPYLLFKTFLYIKTTLLKSFYDTIIV